jgi:hypothetical protein
MIVPDDPRFDSCVYAAARLDALLAGAEPTPRERRRLLALWAEVTRAHDDDCVRAGGRLQAMWHRVDRAHRPRR